MDLAGSVLQATGASPSDPLTEAHVRTAVASTLRFMVAEGVAVTGMKLDDMLEILVDEVENFVIEYSQDVLEDFDKMTGK